MPTTSAMPAISLMPSGGSATPRAGAAGESGFFGLAARRLDYIDQRQKVLAQNIANANTSNYRARDLSPFEVLLQSAPVTPVQTNVNHLAGSIEAASFVLQQAAERAPDGNSVSTETQLTKVADDETSSSMVGNLWKTTMGMYLTALGRGN